MKYKGKQINIPDLRQLTEYVQECCGNRYSAAKIFRELSMRNWCTRQKTPIVDLERTLKAMVNSTRKWEYLTDVEQDKIKKGHKNARAAKFAKDKIAHIKERGIFFSPYKEQLKDIKWRMFRAFVLVVRGSKCEVCGAEKNLQIHHLAYKRGVKAWEYTCNEVVVLCEQCHRKAHGLSY